MENKLMIFENDAFGKVRTLNLNGEPWFVAADVCTALELGHPSLTVERLDEDEKGISTIDTLGGKQRMAIINEPGLYSLVITSRKPEAKAFKRWITHEVIPAIRKHGAYMTKSVLEQVLENPELVLLMLPNLPVDGGQRRRTGRVSQGVGELGGRSLLVHLLKGKARCDHAGFRVNDALLFLYGFLGYLRLGLFQLLHALVRFSDGLFQFRRCQLLVGKQQPGRAFTHGDSPPFEAYGT